MSRPPERILVVRTDRLGDVVLATPLIRSLRRSFPDAWIAAMVRPYAEPVLRNNPYLNEILLDDSDGADAGWRGFLRLVRRIAARRFDTALVLLPKSRLSWMLFLAGIRTRVGVELRLDHVLTFMRRVSRRSYLPLRHEADYCLDLGRAIGAVDNGLKPDVVVTDDERAAARERMKRLGVRMDSRLVGIHPVSGGSAPNWKPPRYRELAELLLRDPGTTVILTGSLKDEPLLAQIAGNHRDRVIPMPAGDLRETMAVLSLLHVMVSASTGPMHLAAGLGVPTVALFCPLPACSPVLWGPLGTRAEVILPEQGYCQEMCPGDPHVCTFDGGITPEDVATAVGRILS